MSDPFATILLILLLIASGLIIFLVSRKKNESAALEPRFDSIEKGIERAERSLRDELSKSRQEAGLSSKTSREELNAGLGAFKEDILKRMNESVEAQKRQLDIFADNLKHLTLVNEQRGEKLRDSVERQLKTIQEDNNKKLEEMRRTVDEKLHSTLEKRLGESFKLVSERLELVHRGLGEMQTLASGVGDLKKVLSNVKTRGTFGEIQLNSLLEQVLTKEQYETNVPTKKNSTARVEFAIKLPGRDDLGSIVRLPIDAKFPQEDYLRLIEAEEKGNPQGIEDASKQLERSIKEMAKNISEKYLDPPNTTDFGIMFLPTEGLYAEVLRRTGLFELLQRDFKVIITGPTTLAALLNSLQMGFRTLAIEKRSSEVWTLLGAVKTEFASFGEILDKTKKKLQEASNTIETAASKSRNIERKLKNVQGLPSAEEPGLFGPAE